MTTSPLVAQQLTSDLESSDAERVRGALEAMDLAWKKGAVVTVAMPEPHCLEAFGEAAPASIISTYFSVLRHYAAFNPIPSDKTVWHAMIEAIVRYGRADADLVHELAIALRTDSQPRSAVEQVLERLQLLGSDETMVARTAHQLVDLLLESDKTRAATIEGLRRWTYLEDFARLIQDYQPRLTAEERARLVQD